MGLIDLRPEKAIGRWQSGLPRICASAQMMLWECVQNARRKMRVQRRKVQRDFRGSSPYQISSFFQSSTVQSNGFTQRTELSDE